jgi:hypothetical protein
MTNRDTLDDPKPTFEDLTLLPSQAAGKGYSHASRIERGLVIQPDTVTDFGQYRPSLSSIKTLDAARARLFSSNDRDPTLSTSHSKPVVTPTANSSRARHPATPDATPTNSSRECHPAAPNVSSITTPVGTSAAVNLTNRGRRRSNRSGNRQRAKSAAAGTVTQRPCEVLLTLRLQEPDRHCDSVFKQRPPEHHQSGSHTMLIVLIVPVVLSTAPVVILTLTTGY